MDENRLPKWDSDSEDTDSYNFPDMQLTVSKFISDVVTTIKAQADTKNYDFLTGLPMRSLGERLAAELMQEHNGCLIFLDMDNLKRINDIYGHTGRRPGTETSGQYARQVHRTWHCQPSWRR